MANRREWQLISIFDKDRRAAITTVKSPAASGDADQFIGTMQRNKIKIPDARLHNINRPQNKFINLPAERHAIL